MGSPRPRPKHLAANLLKIRRDLGISQAAMVKRLGVNIPYTNLSKYELDKNEPPLVVLLAYSRVSGIPVSKSLTTIIFSIEVRLRSLIQVVPLALPLQYQYALRCLVLSL